MAKVLYSIGYASKSIDEFVDILKAKNINCLIDVRTSPYSAAFKDFNKENINKILSLNNIYYLNFNDGFGARRSEASVYRKVYSLKGVLVDQVSFDEVYKTKEFLSCVERVETGINKGFNICFMCSEKDPLNCHRFWMVGYYFVFNKGFVLNNIISKDDIRVLSVDNKEMLNPAFLEFEKEKKNFYRNHPELNQYSLFLCESSCDEQWWNNFFSTHPTDSLDSLREFNNIRIGYSKGENEND